MSKDERFQIGQVKITNRKNNMLIVVICNFKMYFHIVLSCVVIVVLFCSDLFCLINVYSLSIVIWNKGE